MGRPGLADYDLKLNAVLALDTSHRRKLLGRILKRARYRVDLTTRDAAELIGCPQQNLVDWELGNIPVPPHRFTGIWESYGMRNWELYAMILLQHPEASVLATLILVNEGGEGPVIELLGRVFNLIERHKL